MILQKNHWTSLPYRDTCDASMFLLDSPLLQWNQNLGWLGYVGDYKNPKNPWDVMGCQNHLF